MSQFPRPMVVGLLVYRAMLLPAETKDRALRYPTFGSLVQRRSGLISEAEPWRYVRSPNRFASFGPLKVILATKTTFWSKCCWKDNANMIKWSLIIPTYRGLTIRRPGLYIYIYLFRSSALVIFVTYMHVYTHGWTIWGGSAASAGGYRVHCSLQSGESCMGSTWRLFLHHQEIPWFVPLGTASWRNKSSFNLLHAAGGSHGKNHAINDLSALSRPNRSQLCTRPWPNTVLLCTWSIVEHAWKKGCIYTNCRDQQVLQNNSTTYLQIVLKISLTCLLKFTKFNIKLCLNENKNCIYIYIYI